MPFILQTSGLSKKIGSKALVTDVNIHIPKGGNLWFSWS